MPRDYARRPARILLVEDNLPEARLVEEALAEGGLPVVLDHVRDGVEAMAFLRREPPFAGAPRPDLLLLDLNLPRKDGREVLAEVKSDPALMELPVVVLTTSQAEQDIARSYRLRANCYVTKPIDFDGMAAVAREIQSFWFGVVCLPDCEGM